MATGINYCQNGRLAKAKVTLVFGHRLLAIISKVFLKKKNSSVHIWLLWRHFYISRIQIADGIASTTCVKAKKEALERRIPSSPVSDAAWYLFD